jgi:hypothetical protein
MARRNLPTASAAEAGLKLGGDGYRSANAREGGNGMAMNELWAYREPGWSGMDLDGFLVEGLDGTIGHVQETVNAPGGGYVVIDTGPWIFGRKTLLPVGLIDRIHPEERKIFVERTKDAVKEAPGFDDDRAGDDAYLGEFGEYYASLGGARSVQV